MTPRSFFVVFLVCTETIQDYFVQLFALTFPFMFSKVPLLKEVKFLTYQSEVYLLVLFRTQMPPLNEQSRHNNTK